MTTLEKLAKSGMNEAYDHFTTLCRSPDESQFETLMEILSENANSEFGEKHDFANIADIDTYRKNVPVTSWSDYEPYCERMANGETDLLFPGAPTVFISTSGTEGRPKLVPETAKSSLAKNITDKLRRKFTIGAHPNVLKGKILPLVNSSSLGETPCGIPFGTASGLTMANHPPALLATSAFPLPILSVDDEEALDYLTTRFILESDTRMIIGNNIARMEKLAKLAEKNAERIINDIENGETDLPDDILGDLKTRLTENLKPNPARARELRGILNSGVPFTPASYWPNMEVICCWLSGSVGASVGRVRHLFGNDVEYLDYGYGASEGKFNIPSTPGESAGTLAIHAGFHEFLPLDTDDDAPLLASQLKDGERYRLIITNFAGLHRYDMKDIVEVKGFTGKTPNIVFISKAGDMGNIAGEKLAGSTIAAAAVAVGGILRTPIVHIAAVTSSNPPRYTFCVEWDKSGSDSTTPAEIAAALDAKLKEDIGYRNKRRDNLLLPPEVVIMREGWLDAIYAARNASGAARAQTKLPVIHETIPLPEYIIQ